MGVASLHSLKWSRTGLPSTKLAAPACEPIRGLFKTIQNVARSKSYTRLTNITKYWLDVVTMCWDWSYMKVGWLVSMPITMEPQRQANGNLINVLGLCGPCSSHAMCKKTHLGEFLPVQLINPQVGDRFFTNTAFFTRTQIYWCFYLFYYSQPSPSFCFVCSKSVSLPTYL